MCSIIVIFALSSPVVFFFNDTATTEIYTLSLHDALPISGERTGAAHLDGAGAQRVAPLDLAQMPAGERDRVVDHDEDRKSTRLNSSHANISYAVFCLKKKKINYNHTQIFATLLFFPI